MAKTHNDKRPKRARPPAWEPPKLLLVSGFDPVVSTIGTLLVVSTRGGVWLLGSIDIRCIIELVWEKKEQSNREYSSKVLARLTSDLFYLCTGIK